MENAIEDLPHSSAYRDSDRGDRTTPNRRNRVHSSLTLLNEKLLQIVSSDLLAGGSTLLDYGCGSKPYEALFKGKFPKYVGADLPGNSRADLIIGLNGALPSRDNTFDCVLSTQALEHVIDPRSYLREAFRVLKPQGSLIVSTHGIWPYHPDPTDFWRWTIDGLQLEITQAGFEIVMIKSVFGIESAALQLWQDSTLERLPQFLRPLYTWFFQTIIWRIERRHPDKLSNDASIYLVVARKPNASELPASNRI